MFYDYLFLEAVPFVLSEEKNCDRVWDGEIALPRAIDAATLADCRLGAAVPALVRPLPRLDTGVTEAGVWKVSVL